VIVGKSSVLEFSNWLMFRMKGILVDCAVSLNGYKIGKSEEFDPIKNID
jgi:hypothetical protein